MGARSQSSVTVVFLTLALSFNDIGEPMGEPVRTTDGAGHYDTEAKSFLARLGALPAEEQRRQLDALVAQLPPNAAPGDPARARRLLLAALDEGREAVRRALWFAPVEKSAPVILEAIAQDTPQVRTAGIELIHLVLASGGPADPFRPALPALREAVVCDEHNRRFFAVAALQRMGEDGIRCLLAGLANSEPLDRRAAASIADYPDVAIPELQRALKAGDPVRRNAMALLMRLAPEGKQVVPDLVPLLDETEPTVPADTPFLLGRYGYQTRAGVIAAEAAFLLGLYGPEARQAVPKLLELITDDEPELRRTASRALANIGIEAEQIERLWGGVLCIEERDKDSRLYENYGFAAASPGRAALPELVKALSHPDPRVRQAASCACEYLGPVAASAAVPLLEAASRTWLEPEELRSRETLPLRVAESYARGAATDALTTLGSGAAPIAEELVKRFESALFGLTMGGRLYFDPPAARALANIGPAALPAIYEGLASENVMVQAGCARTLQLMDPIEAKGAAPHLLRLFDQSSDERVRILALKALINLGAQPDQLLPRLRPIALPESDDRGLSSGSLAAVARWYLDHHKEGAARPGLLGNMPGMNSYAPYVDPADFTWGRPSGGLQLGVSLPPAEYEIQKNEPDVQRLHVAVRNVGQQPVVLPLDGPKLWGLDMRLAEAPDVLCRLNWAYRFPPRLRELRPGQVAVIRPAISYEIAYGRRNAQGRWTRFTPEEREYHLTAALRGLDAPDPPHLPCYASAAVRRECWNGEIQSGTIAVRVDSAINRQRPRSGANDAAD